MDDSERQRGAARRWMAASLLMAAALLGLGIRYAPRTPVPARRRPAAEANPQTTQKPEPPASEPPPPAIPPWLYFVVPQP